MKNWSLLWKKMHQTDYLEANCSCAVKHVQQLHQQAEVLRCRLLWRRKRMLLFLRCPETSCSVFGERGLQEAFLPCSSLGSFLRSFPAFLFLFLLKNLSSLPLFFKSWYFSASSSFFLSAEDKRKLQLVASIPSWSHQNRIR